MEQEKLQDEIFCLNYELQTLATYITAGKLERWLPGFSDLATDFDHMQRYNWACSYVKDKTVLDIACGSGKGSYMLATGGKAKSVLGCDIEAAAVRYSSIKYTAPNLAYEVQDATAFHKNTLFDTIISFETVEHIPATGLYLEAIAKHLHADGRFIVSTPVSALDVDHTPSNPYHVIEWGFKKFQEVISKKFTIEKIFVQLHNERPYTFMERRMNRFFPKKADHTQTKLVEFSSQINLSKLGKQQHAYQILVCKKK